MDSVAPVVALTLGAAMMLRALHLYSISQPGVFVSQWRRLALWLTLMLLWPRPAFAQSVGLREGMEAGNAIIMYLTGSLAAVGVLAAGIAMMKGRHDIAKWAFAGAMVTGLAFPIVRTMWSNLGIEASNVGSFSQ